MRGSAMRRGRRWRGCAATSRSRSRTPKATGVAHDVIGCADVRCRSLARNDAARPDPGSADARRRCAPRRRTARACDLYKRGTQTVFGEGAPKATLMLVGEQPGDAGGSDRPSVRRSRRQAAGSRARRSGHRSARRSTSPTSSSTSSGSRAASGGSTRSRTPARSRPAGRGSTPRSRW